MEKRPYVVAIIGGAVSGAEAAFQFASNGISVVVFDQNKLPYGKIEDGLPKWHNKLRDKEEGRINEKLDHPLVKYVPNCQLGKDISFSELVNDWGFSIIVLANGAWKDRPLPIADVEQFVDDQIIYQNSFIYWFNHKHEPDYTGPKYNTPQGAVIIGGGLASLDMAKLLMFEYTEAALRRRGIETHLFELDRSIPKALENLGVTFEELDINPCKLVYRRRKKDMPLSPFRPETAELLAKAEAVREKIFDNYQSKYLFEFEPLMSPAELMVEGENLAGIKFYQNRMDGENLITNKDSKIEIKTPLIISSIGSIPYEIDGVPMDGSVYSVGDESIGDIKGFDHVYAVGNAVTGRGNIQESMKHGREVSTKLVGSLLDNTEVQFEQSLRNQESDIADQVSAIMSALSNPLSEAVIDSIQKKTQQLQLIAGYDNNYQNWIKQHLPIRLEDLLGGEH